MKKILILSALTIMRKLRMRRNERVRSVKLDLAFHSEADGDNAIVLTVYSTHDRKAQATIPAQWARKLHGPQFAALEMVLNQAIGDFHTIYKLAMEAGKKTEEKS